MSAGYNPLCWICRSAFCVIQPTPFLPQIAISLSPVAQTSVHQWNSEAGLVVRYLQGDSSHGAAPIRLPAAKKRAMYFVSGAEMRSMVAGGSTVGPLCSVRACVCACARLHAQ